VWAVGRHGLNSIPRLSNWDLSPDAPEDHAVKLGIDPAPA
jgi:hypothetical protein